MVQKPSSRQNPIFSSAFRTGCAFYRSPTGGRKRPAVSCWRGALSRRAAASVPPDGREVPGTWPAGTRRDRRARLGAACFPQKGSKAGGGAATAPRPPPAASRRPVSDDLAAFGGHLQRAQTHPRPRAGLGRRLRPPAARSPRRASAQSSVAGQCRRESSAPRPPAPRGPRVAGRHAQPWGRTRFLPGCSRVARTLARLRRRRGLARMH